MEPNVKIIMPETREQRARDSSLKLVEKIARLLDSRFVIPGTNIRFGLDPIMSMFPVLGDLFTFLISAALIHTMHRHGASGKVVIKMMLNSTFDAVLGTIPVVGTIFDVFYRSNDRNVKLLHEHYFQGKHQGSGKGLLFLVAFICVIIVIAACYGMYKLIELIIQSAS